MKKTETKKPEFDATRITVGDVFYITFSKFDGVVNAGGSMYDEARGTLESATDAAKDAITESHFEDEALVIYLCTPVRLVRPAEIVVENLES